MDDKVNRSVIILLLFSRKTEVNLNIGKISWMFINLLISNKLELDIPKSIEKFGVHLQ